MHPASISGPRTGSILLLSSRTSRCARTSITKSLSSHDLQARALWWWSRHGGEWATQDSDLEERMQRYRRIMKHRYSKALRRRAMWEWEDGKNISPWGLRLPSRWAGRGWADYKGMSSSSPMRADVHNAEPEKGTKGKMEPQEWSEWNKSWHKDFDSFKSAVDKAIEKDPFGTLFGRHMRLRSPPTPNNSSWTSWSWIFEPRRTVDSPSTREGPSISPEKTAWPGLSKEKSDGKASEQSVRMESSIRTTSSVPQTAPTTVVEKASIESDCEYEYDAVSGRKVRKGPKQESEKVPAPEKPFLSSLFSEHGVDIPVKTYKPHKVHGYGAVHSSKVAAAKNSEPETSRSTKKSFESSRLQEIKSLKASILGNSIDTTAEFYGKYEPRENDSPAFNPVEQRRERDLGTEDDAPLFSGTTYESRSDQILPSRSDQKPKSEDVSGLKIVAKTVTNSWLLKEGFQTLDQALEKPSTTNIAPVTSEKQAASRIESSLDRMRARNTAPSSTSAMTNLETDFDKGARKDRVEDVDLLRASDVRAASRTARKTKQDAEQAKEDIRKKLEADYSSGNKTPNEIRDVYPDHFSDTTAKLSKGLNNVWRHIREYPQGIVAKTIRTMGAFNDNYKNYIRVDKPAVDSTEKLVFKDESLSMTPSIYKKVAKPSRAPVIFTPNQDFLDVERESVARRESLKRANEEAKKNETAKQEQASELAKEIRAAYESQYGPIDENHRQPSAMASSSEGAVATSDSARAAKKPHPLMTASAKPGVLQNPIIEKHINDFEPEFARLVDGAREVRRSLHEASSHIKAIKSQRPPTCWNARSVDEVKQATSDSGNGRMVSATGSQQASGEVPASAPDSRPASITLETSLDRNGKVPTTSVGPLPTYIFLAYNPNTGRVDKSPMSSRLFNNSKYHQMQDLAQVLTTLNNAAVFMPHLDQLQASGYELLRGGSDSLVFKRLGNNGAVTSEIVKEVPQVMPQAVETTTQPMVEKMNAIATEEAAAQPSVDPLKTVANKQAATVLDELPPQVEPAPGPAAPIAPPTTSSATTAAEDIKSRVIRRQEPVFSGQNLNSTPASNVSTTVPIRDLNNVPKLTDDISNLPLERLQALYNTMNDHNVVPVRSDRKAWKHKLKAAMHEKWQENKMARDQERNDERHSRGGFFRRFMRGVRRVVLTGAAMASVAYGIGYLYDEGTRGQRQRELVLGNIKATGEGNEVVVNGRRYSVGTRPGIYSTESSR